MVIINIIHLNFSYKRLIEVNRMKGYLNKLQYTMELEEFINKLVYFIQINQFCKVICL